MIFEIPASKQADRNWKGRACVRAGEDRFFGRAGEGGGGEGGGGKEPHNVQVMVWPVVSCPAKNNICTQASGVSPHMPYISKSTSHW